MIISFIGNGFDLEHNIKIEFSSFVKSEIFLKQIGSYKKFFKDDEYKKFSKDGKLWSEFEEYLFYVCTNNKINEKLFITKISIAFQKWMINKKEGLPTKINKSKNVEEIAKSKNIISLNYTDTPEIYGFEKIEFNSISSNSEWDLFNNEKKFINIHSFQPGLPTGKFVLGHDLSEKMNKSKLISSWPENKKFNVKKLILIHIKNNINLIKKICIYGISFGDSDNELKIFIEEISKEVDVKIFTCDNKKPIKNSKKRNIEYINIS